MHILSAIMFAASANIDNFVIGISYGAKKVHFSFISNFLISVITLFGTILSMAFGFELSEFLPISISQIIGNIILILIGSFCIIKYVINSFVKKKKYISKSPEESAKRNVTIKESLALAIALMINNIGIGIGASITGVDLLSACLFTFVFSFSFLFVGNSIGKTFLSKFFGKYGDVVSGAIIIILAVYEMFI